MLSLFFVVNKLLPLSLHILLLYHHLIFLLFLLFHLLLLLMIIRMRVWRFLSLLHLLLMVNTTWFPVAFVLCCRRHALKYVSTSLFLSSHFFSSSSTYYFSFFSSSFFSSCSFSFSSGAVLGCEEHEAV